jgi:hypothetical protein
MCTLIDHKTDIVDIIKSSTLIDVKEILPIIKIILNQNYFEHNGNFYKQTQGLAMGAPTSPILVEHVQYLEHSGIYNILIHHQIVAYFKYVDDVLITYNNKTDINKTIQAFSQLQPSPKFTIELDNKNKFNFLDIMIIKEARKLTFGALGPTQPPVQWVPGVLSPGVKRGRGVMLTTHPHLVPRS